MAAKKTYVFIDGFNLYYGCLKGTPYKWLNLEALCFHYLPEAYHSIEKIYYYTAQVSGTPQNPNAPQRQLQYIRAIKTLPKVQIVQGHFLKEEVNLPRADGAGEVRVVRCKEKQSDVNLASMMMWHACRDHLEAAVLISGDSDFLTPVIYLTEYMKKTVGILDPQRNGTPNSPLNKQATFYKPIRTGVLQSSQFPNQLKDANGDFYKPGEWFEN